MRLEGVDGTQLFGFMVALGTQSLLDDRARSMRQVPPRLSFAADGIAILESGSSLEQLPKVLFDGLQLLRPRFEGDLGSLKKPADFNRESFERAARMSWETSKIVAGLACWTGAEIVESSLCAANGAGHQNLIQSIRDILGLVREEHLQKALSEPWARTYAPPDNERKRLVLGARKPTLRLDPADERLYALRFSNPTTTDDYRTELGAQALAVPAFALLPVLPLQRHSRAVSSRRERNSVFFEWTLWNASATLDAVRAHIYAGVEEVSSRARGAFAAFRVARVSGAKGKLSFGVATGIW